MSERTATVSAVTGRGSSHPEFQLDSAAAPGAGPFDHRGYVPASEARHRQPGSEP